MLASELALSDEDDELSATLDDDEFVSDDASDDELETISELTLDEVPASLDDAEDS